MKTMITMMVMALAMVACGVEEEAPPPETEVVVPEDDTPTCGSFADPNIDFFGGCNEHTIGAVYRYDNDDGTISLYRCSEEGWVNMPGARCTFDEDGNCYVGCAGRF